MFTFSVLSFFFSFIYEDISDELEGLEWRLSQSLFVLVEAKFKADWEEELTRGISIWTFPLTKRIVQKLYHTHNSYSYGIYLVVSPTEIISLQD